MFSEHLMRPNDQPRKAGPEFKDYPLLAREGMHDVKNSNGAR